MDGFVVRPCSAQLPLSRSVGWPVISPHWAASDGPIAAAMNEKPKAVFSHTPKQADWGPTENFGGDLSAEARGQRG